MTAQDISCRLPVECEFDIGSFRLRAKRWMREGGLPVLALHGWLDNAASFDFLAPLLPQLDLVCLDLAGHGRSDHRNHRGAYNIWQDVGEVFSVADELGWQSFGLLGHSRGAIISMLAAGTFPERVKQLALVEGICPHLGVEQDAPQTLATSIIHINKQSQRQKRRYSAFDAAVQARENGMFALSHADASALAQRGVAATDEGHVWLHDSKLVAESELRLTVGQLDAFVQRVRARRLLVMAEQGIFAQNGQFHDWLHQHPEIPQVSVPGHHHCHMSEHADRVAAELNHFFTVAND